MMALGLIVDKGTKGAAAYVFANTNQANAFKELLAGCLTSPDRHKPQSR
jgi:hypothetical protein